MGQHFPAPMTSAEIRKRQRPSTQAGSAGEAPSPWPTAVPAKPRYRRSRQGVESPGSSPIAPVTPWHFGYSVPERPAQGARPAKSCTAHRPAATLPLESLSRQLPRASNPKVAALLAPRPRALARPRATSRRKTRRSTLGGGKLGAPRWLGLDNQAGRGRARARAASGPRELAGNGLSMGSAQFCYLVHQA